MAQKRLTKEYTKVQQETADTGVAVSLVDDDLFHWRVTLAGPEGSPYVGGVFFLDLKFPTDFPFKPPKVLFTTKVYHANITEKGEVCLGILKDDWSPALTSGMIFSALRSLLIHPNVDSPQMPEIAALYNANREQHDATAAEWTRKYAC